MAAKWPPRRSARRLLPKCCWFGACLRRTMTAVRPCLTARLETSAKRWAHSDARKWSNCASPGQTGPRGLRRGSGGRGGWSAHRLDTGVLRANARLQSRDCPGRCGSPLLLLAATRASCAIPRASSRGTCRSVRRLPFPQPAPTRPWNQGTRARWRAAVAAACRSRRRAGGPGPARSDPTSTGRFRRRRRNDAVRCSGASRRPCRAWRGRPASAVCQ